MENLNKTSPFLFPNPAVKKEIRNGWEIALNYENENPSLAIVDLSHKNKWELYDQNLAGKPLDNLHIPKSNCFAVPTISGTDMADRWFS